MKMIAKTMAGSEFCYSEQEYINALHWFGYTVKRAKSIVEERKNNGSFVGLNSLVREYKRHIA